MRKTSAQHLFFAVMFGTFLGAALRAADEPAPATSIAKPDFEKLLRLNGHQIFGGKVQVVGEEFEATFDGPGQVPKGFEGEGVMDEKHPQMKGGNRKFILKEKKGDTEVLYPNFCAAGISDPQGKWSTWTSRFPVGGNVKVKFDLRLPGLVTSASGLFVRVNVDGKSFIGTNFFNQVEKVGFGKVIGKKDTALKEYAAHPMKWFPRNKPDGIPVEIAAQEGKMRVSVMGKEIVSMDKVGDVSHGKIAFGYRKIVFTLQNMKISGKLDRAWCEKELAELEKAGKLIITDPNELPPALPPEPGQPGAEPAKAGAGQ